LKRDFWARMTGFGCAPSLILLFPVLKGLLLRNLLKVKLEDAVLVGEPHSETASCLLLDKRSSE